jgi:ABC-type Fe3+/spermidine/putrescine transport system ATPase subunit
MGGDHRVRLELPGALRPGEPIQVAVRPENLQVVPASAGPPAAGLDAVPARVAAVTFLGNAIDCHVILDDGTRVRIQAGPGEVLTTGQRVHVRFDDGACTVFAT